MPCFCIYTIYGSYKTVIKLIISTNVIQCLAVANELFLAFLVFFNIFITIISNRVSAIYYCYGMAQISFFDQVKCLTSILNYGKLTMTRSIPDYFFAIKTFSDHWPPAETLVVNKFSFVLSTSSLPTSFGLCNFATYYQVIISTDSRKKSQYSLLLAGF